MRLYKSSHVTGNDIIESWVEGLGLRHDSTGPVPPETRGMVSGSEIELRLQLHWGHSTNTLTAKCSLVKRVGLHPAGPITGE